MFVTSGGNFVFGADFEKKILGDSFEKKAFSIYTILFYCYTILIGNA